EGMNGRQINLQKQAGTLILLELGLIVGCGIFGTVLLAFAGDASDAQPRREPERLLLDYDHVFDVAPSAAVRRADHGPEGAVMDAIPVAGAATEGMTAQPPPLPRAPAREVQRSSGDSWAEAPRSRTSPKPEGHKNVL